MTVGIDLALAMVEEDYGTRRARGIARDLVAFLRRTASQSQFSSLLSAQASARRPIEDLAPWIVDNLLADLSVGALAARCGIDGGMAQFEGSCVNARYRPSARTNKGESTPVPVKSAHTIWEARRAGFQSGSGELVKQSLHR